MSLKIKLQTPYNYYHMVSREDIFPGNEDTLIDQIIIGMKLHIEKFENLTSISPEIKYLFQNAHKLNLHLHLPEIRVLEDIPGILLVCEGWNEYICQKKIREQKLFL